MVELFGLSRDSVAAMMREGLSFPSDNRAVIWKKVLGLPCLRTCYLDLISNRKLQATGKDRILENIKLDFGCDLAFAESLIDSLSSNFGDKELLVYEMTRTILVNWCRDWILLSPNPPFPILAFCSTLLRYHESELFAHIAGLQVDDYAWQLLSTFFRKVIEPAKWLELMDHILPNHPSFIIFIPVALLRVHKKKILAIKDKHSLLNFFDFPPTLTDPALLARLAYDYYDTTPKEIHPKQYLSKFEPMVPTDGGHYPPAPQSAFAAVSLLNLNGSSLAADNIQRKELPKHLEGIGISVDWEHGEAVLDAGFATRKQIIDALQDLTY